MPQAAEKAFLAWRLMARALLLQYIKRAALHLDLRQLANKINREVKGRSVVAIHEDGTIDVYVEASDVIPIIRFLAREADSDIAENAEKLRNFAISPLNSITCSTRERLS